MGAPSKRGKSQTAFSDNGPPAEPPKTDVCESVCLPGSHGAKVFFSRVARIYPEVGIDF